MKIDWLWSDIVYQRIMLLSKYCYFPILLFICRCCSNMSKGNKKQLWRIHINFSSNTDQLLLQNITFSIIRPAVYLELIPIMSDFGEIS